MKLFEQFPCLPKHPDFEPPSSRQSRRVSSGASSEVTSPKSATPAGFEEDPLLDVYGSWEGFPPDISMPKCLTEATAAVRRAREYQEWAGFDNAPAAIRPAEKYQEWAGIIDPVGLRPARKYQEWAGFDDPPVQNVCLCLGSGLYSLYSLWTTDRRI